MYLKKYTTRIYPRLPTYQKINQSIVIYQQGTIINNIILIHLLIFMFYLVLPPHSKSIFYFNYLMVIHWEGSNTTLIQPYIRVHKPRRTIYSWSTMAYNKAYSHIMVDNKATKKRNQIIKSRCVKHTISTLGLKIT